MFSVKPSNLGKRITINVILQHYSCGQLRKKPEISTWFLTTTEVCWLLNEGCEPVSAWFPPPLPFVSSTHINNVSGLKQTVIEYMEYCLKEGKVHHHFDFKLALSGKILYRLPLQKANRHGK